MEAAQKLTLNHKDNTMYMYSAVAYSTVNNNAHG